MSRTFSCCTYERQSKRQVRVNHDGVIAIADDERTSRVVRPVIGGGVAMAKCVALSGAGRDAGNHLRLLSLSPSE